MGTGFVVAYMDTHLPGVLDRRVDKGLLQRHIALTQQGELSTPFHQLTHDLGQQMKPLLLGQPAHDTEHQRLCARLQPEAHLKRTFGDRLVRQTIHVVTGG